jgi:hypothetical protein
MSSISDTEQEELELALAISLSQQDVDRCSQSSAFLTNNQIPNQNRVVDPALTPARQGRDIERNLLTTNRDICQRSQPTSNDRSGQSFSAPEAPPPLSRSNPPASIRALPRRLADEFIRMRSGIFCSGCQQAILGTHVTAMGGNYHPGCMVCAACNGKLSGMLYPKGDPPLPYHKACAEEIFNPRCCLCDATLTGNYLKHPFFTDEIYCQSHTHLRQCFSCCRKLPVSEKKQNERFTELHDGRVSCLECISTAIVDSAEALPLYLEAVDFMEHVLHLPIPPGMRQVPILAVDLPSLNEQQSNNKNEAHRILDEGASITRGLTLYTSGQIRHMTAGYFNTVTGFFSAGPPTVYHIETVQEVTAVLVLFALPRDLTASILAHEAMHVWFRLTKNFPSTLPSKVEEGLCQVISRSYLDNISVSSPTASGSSSDSKTNNVGESQESRSYGRGHPRPSNYQAVLQRLEYCPEVSSDRSELEKKRILRAFFCCQIETNSSAIYGDGYREAQKCVAELGLDIVLEVVRETRKLPQV